MKEFESSSANVRIPEGHSATNVKLYFWIGIIFAIFLRAMIIADHYSSLLSNLMWYMGVIGYLIFFAHRYDIAKRRYNIIKNRRLLEKI